MALLVRLLENRGGPDWKGITLPPGRTQKACLHVWAKLREEAKKADWYNTPDDSAGDVSTPTKAKDQPKKRVAKTGNAPAVKRSKKNEDSEEVKTPVKAEKVKAEENEDDDEI